MTDQTNREQFDPETVLKRIGFSALEPENQNRYITNPFAGIAQLIRNNDLLDSDEIVLLGAGGRVFTGFVVRDGEFHPAYEVTGHYNHAAGTYEDKHFPKLEDGSHCYASVQKLTVRDFKDRYMQDSARVVVPIWRPEDNL